MKKMIKPTCIIVRKVMKVIVEQNAKVLKCKGLL